MKNENRKNENACPVHGRKEVVQGNSSLGIFFATSRLCENQVLRKERRAGSKWLGSISDTAYGNKSLSA